MKYRFLLKTTLKLSVFFFLMMHVISSALCRTSIPRIVFTANQSWNSRIYVMDMQGNTLRYHHYEYYIFCDLEIIDNEVYATDWVAPCLYRVDTVTGDLTQIVNDISLIYMYDVAFDGTFFYLDEGTLNRYHFTGGFQSSASFSQSVRGSTFAMTYYWTLLSSGEIKCWDISAWPTITEIPENAFSPPSEYCRGLWYDGEYLWTAEQIDGSLGYIFRFDFDGNVVDQWLAPAFKGYAAGLIVTPCSNHGDANGDNQITAGDAQLAFQFALGVIQPTEEEACAADCNGDEAITSGDAQLIFMTALGQGQCSDPL